MGGGLHYMGLTNYTSNTPTLTLIYQSFCQGHNYDWGLNVLVSICLFSRVCSNLNSSVIRMHNNNTFFYYGMSDSSHLTRCSGNINIRNILIWFLSYKEHVYYYFIFHACFVHRFLRLSPTLMKNKVCRQSQLQDNYSVRKVR